jgi:hypothetical protein
MDNAMAANRIFFIGGYSGGRARISAWQPEGLTCHLTGKNQNSRSVT